MSGRHLLVLGLIANPAWAGENSVVAGEKSDDADVEEVVVVGERVEGRHILIEYLENFQDIRYDGWWLYRQGRYDEAFPLLLEAAKVGFKKHQARVSYLYATGLGTPRNTDAAVGFLGIAAKHPTHPEIFNAFKEVWGRIPEEHRPRYRAIIADYETRYGSRASRVLCNRDRRAGTWMRDLRCEFAELTPGAGVHTDLSWVPELVNRADP